jgi:hypothetical protein
MRDGADGSRAGEFAGEDRRRRQKCPCGNESEQGEGKEKGAAIALDLRQDLAPVDYRDEMLGRQG